jgi:hypothetical protein
MNVRLGDKALERGGEEEAQGQDGTHLPERHSAAPPSHTAGTLNVSLGCRRHHQGIYLRIP